MLKIILKIIVFVGCIVIGGAIGLFIFYPGVIFKTPDQLSILTLLTLPGGIISGGIIGYMVSKKIE